MSTNPVVAADSSTNEVFTDKPHPHPHPHHIQHSRSNSIRRPSFGSIKEDDSGIAQSFVDTQPHSSSSQNPHSKTAKTAVQVQSQSPEFCCPCGAFRGWKQIQLGGRKQSRSYSDLRLLGSSHSKGWAWEVENKRPALEVEPKEEDEQGEGEAPKVKEKGRARLEMLPVEILDQIISKLALDIPPNGYTPRNMDLIACLLTSRTLHSATLSVLYRNITIPHSVIFSKALNHIKQYPALGTIVRRLDFSHFSSVGLGRTQQMNIEIQNLTSKTLLECLDLVPNLKEGLFQEHVENDVNGDVIRKLLGGMPRLRALDFCACSSQTFISGFLNTVIEEPHIPSVLPNLRRLSLHECSTLPVAAYEALLPRLINMTHLDLAHTQITEGALFSIPHSASITHLNLSRCTRLTGSKVVEFLTTHPAVRDSLVYLNLMADVSRYRLLDNEDVKALLPTLPSSLKSLNLGGAKITSEDVPLLLPLTKHVEELGLNSADLTMKDLNSFFVPPPPPTGEENGDANGSHAPHTPWVQPALHYLDLTKVPNITQAALFNSNVSVLVTPQSYPLEVLEFSERIIAPLRERTKNAKSRIGWVVRDLGRRGWFVREPEAMPVDANGVRHASDDGRRPWKMGARWWGMKKIPVAVGEVGGLYGHYMFKK